ncbi:bifunctional phosphopantothenoylcysteine decarboxylase/phosphopantothenate synthase [Aurantiacibacter poecillastricola]|uniref:bifunctional phosphopantothenoylcysteine decarboxylase/phosphopantothenate synthase n=1 Tax=Aurantiacibacter poecillastricola TaxID=3064385 RepID=UPI00273F4A40|nr:bifunctional phosphopantothenoylcysteine decarboxylase/phosphopantothenate synthase [Aurantiacibacter sp. 219JJ12-13]MDP5261046.1 bifunctional phosphopantothenoylcysteine decarboxylase/phosphopantothenate synthase [Aurantiacibacter sp. 219JJ12-13]
MLEQRIDTMDEEGQITGPRILLVVGGGIAAYKSCELVRLIAKGGGESTCVLTEGGAQFVTPMALAALSGNQVHTSLWDLKNEAEIGHIQLSREADLVVVCPATANMLAKMSAGIADDLATTMILATDKPVLTVPAMNVKMWQHEATQRNIEWLRQSGVRVMTPDEGAMACGEWGPGRLPDPEMVWLEIADMLGLDPGAVGSEIEDYLRAVEAGAEDDYQDDSDPHKDTPGGLAGMLASIIPRSTPRRIEDDEVTFDGEELEEGEYEGEGALEGPELPEPDYTGAEHLMATKGKAKAAPPTDREAINHEVNARQEAPQPFEGEEAAAPVNPLELGHVQPAALDPIDTFDPLEGQPAFEQDIEHRPLYGKHVLVTAGPTHEAIDPVRYLANRSSGKQGFAIAAAAAAAGAKVTLVAGPVHLRTPLGVERIDVESAEEMAQAVREALPVDAAVMVAAVADWRTRDYADAKIKKRGSAPPALVLTENPDILASVAASPKRPELLIGFAAETNDVVDNARKKRKSKGVDWIVANDVSGEVMGGDDNQVHLVKEGKVEHWEAMTKQDVASKLVSEIAAKLNADD